MKTFKGLIGFDMANVKWEEVTVVTEVITSGIDQDGYPKSETLGLGVIEDNSCCIYRGSIQDSANNFPCIWISDELSLKNIGDSLQELGKLICEIKGKENDESH